MDLSIRHEFILNLPPAGVWRYLTDPELLALWLMPNDLRPVPGHRFSFRTRAKPRFGFDGTVHCEVLEAVEPRRLVYSWKGGGAGSKPLLDTVVTWTLEVHERGTLLRLEHSGFHGLRNLLPFTIMKAGWVKIGKRLAAAVQSHSDEP